MRRFALLFSALVVLGCSSDSAPATLAPTDANIVGTFSLTSSNGHNLPFVVLLTLDEEWDITSDQFVIAADNTWIETTNYTVTTLANGAQRTTATQASGTYTVGSGQINFTMIVGGTNSFTGSVTGNTLSLLFNGGHFLYTR